LAEGRVVVEGDYESLALGRNFNFAVEENGLNIKLRNERLVEAVNDGDLEAARLTLDRTDNVSPLLLHDGFGYLPQEDPRMFFETFRSSLKA